ncbi:DNA-binding protein [Vibrio rarus]|uniref:DNA-binding protein n=1 Tax=Vibrio rarus TaxID=413403 RepID=UPI0021C395B0|nr:DNA-binding protein [Vibrio rarus]
MTTALTSNQLQDKVTEICNELYSKGQKTSVRIVLSMLPEVNSTSTIHKYYKTWKDELEANQKSLLEKMGFSEEFTRVFMSEITRHATEAERRYRDIAEDAKDQSMRAIEDLERAEERLHKQTALLEQRELQIKTLQAENSQNNKAQEAVVQELRQQIELSNQEVSDLSDSNERLRTDLAKNELLLDGNKDLVATTKAHNDQLAEELKQLNIELVSNAKEITKLESKQEIQEALIIELKETKSSLSDQNKVLDSDLRSVNQDRHGLQVSLSSLQNIEQKLSGELTSKSDELSQCKATIVQQNETIKRHERSLLEKDEQLAQHK